MNATVQSIKYFPHLEIENYDKIYNNLLLKKFASWNDAATVLCVIAMSDAFPITNCS